MSEQEPTASVSEDEPCSTSSDILGSEPPSAPAIPTSPARDEATPTADADRRSTLLRPRNLVVIGVAVSAVLVAAVVGPVAWDAWRNDGVRIVTPEHVAGLVLDDSQGAHDTIDYLRTAVQTGVSLEKSTGAVYADEAGQSRSVLFVGGTGFVGSADDALAKTFQLISDDAGGVEGVRAVSPGPLGGAMKCGSTKTDGDSMAVCGWADRGSLGVAMFPNRPVDQSAELMRTMRQAIQKGS